MSSDEAADDAEDPGHVSFIIMRAEDTFDGQDRVMSRQPTTSRSSPQVLVMREASDGTQVGPCSRESPRGNQYLGRGEDAHHASMGAVRRSMTTAARPSSAGR